MPQVAQDIGEGLADGGLSHGDSAKLRHAGSFEQFAAAAWKHCAEVLQWSEASGGLQPQRVLPAAHFEALPTQKLSYLVNPPDAAGQRCCHGGGGVGGGLLWAGAAQ